MNVACQRISLRWAPLSFLTFSQEKSVSANRRTVDDIVVVHDAFLHRTVEACLLTNKELVRTLTKLMTTMLMFADQMKLFTEATRIVRILNVCLPLMAGRPV